ncbi:hypothetical protein E8E11_007632 [Didymella keratinophila]|nr:hypothetical protein E8E11_007632 [Didymella keratinophila]
MRLTIQTTTYAAVSLLTARASGSPIGTLETHRAYVKGIWTSTFRYRQSTDTFYWIGCISGGPSYVWAASGTHAAKNNGEVDDWNWTSQGTLPRCYYDNGLLIDDDDTMYITYGSTTINIAQLNKDDTAEVKNQAVYTSPDNVYIEGSRLYKINGTYYIWVTKPAVSPEMMSPKLSPEWEWNHDPDESAYSFKSGLQLRAATVTNDLFTARNTPTRRIPGPKSAGTFRIDVSGLKDGDRVGAVLFRDVVAYIGVHKSGSSSSLVMVNNLNLDNNWKTNSTGTVAATGPSLAANAEEVYLRIESDITPAFGTNTTRTTAFWYSLDGKSFNQLGKPFPMSNTWQFFTGYRFGVFNFATKALGG